ncbi:D-alanine transaminase [Methylohalomonas lacus]|uniref:Aminodeoxychorismate lyase n=1 Tax=Methylohalomonas lacus TaxID=398773 RepID=A0AAE3L169_9GAMM|nr:D-amino acid aminotransferase [Methylohalomonas lacus]MCS3903160.1 D-alanine transaminase [Methylohalomonas lacus]
MSLVYLNGDFVALEEARISPLDRGFTFGDGVYEVIPVYNRRVFRLKEHLERLENSLKLIYMRNPLPVEEWKRILDRLVTENAGDDQSIYLQVTRGVSPRDHVFNDEMQATVFIMTKPLEQPDNSAGSAAIVRPDIRWQWCHIKAITLLPSVLLRHEASLSGAREAILVNQGLVTEGAASNVFICESGKVLTPPKSRQLLPGITRDLVIELLQQNGIECSEYPVPETQLRSADEIWITSSTQEIVPITVLDGEMVGSGQPGPLWQHAARIYRDFKQEFSQHRSSDV